MGVIAQDVETVAPILVSTKKVKLHADDKKETDIKVVNYSAFIYAVINSVKELYAKWFNDSQDIHRELAALEQDNAALKAKAEKLDQENAAIKSFLCSKDRGAIFCKN